MNWWNHIPEHINPNIIEIGSFQIRYYGLMYLVAFAITYLLILHRLKSERYDYSKEVVRQIRSIVRSAENGIMIYTKGIERALNSKDTGV